MSRQPQQPPGGYKIWLPDLTQQDEWAHNRGGTPSESRPPVQDTRRAPQPQPQPDSEPFRGSETPFFFQGKKPHIYGVNSDLWKGTMGKPGGQTLAIKVFRTKPNLTDMFSESLEDGLEPQFAISHLNVLRVHGTYFDRVGNEVGVIYPWCEKRNVIEYLGAKPCVENNEAIYMMRGITKGLKYLHDHDIVHGNIKSGNVIVSHYGDPMLTDIGMLEIMEKYGISLWSSTCNSSIRWTAPELLRADQQNSKRTKQSDIYALATTFLEVMALRLPYSEKTDAQVVDHVLHGGVPKRPPQSAEWGPCDKLWLFMNSCWNHHPVLRPKITAVNQELGMYLTHATPDPSYSGPLSPPGP